MTLPKGWMWLEAVPTSSIRVDGMNITGPGSAFLALQFFHRELRAVTGNYNFYAISILITTMDKCNLYDLLCIVDILIEILRRAGKLFCTHCSGTCRTQKQ